MFIRCINEPYYKSQHRDSGKEALINIKNINCFCVEYDNAIYAYTKDDTRYLVSRHADIVDEYGEPVFDILCKAVREDWKIFCGITEEEQHEQFTFKAEEEPSQETGDNKRTGGQDCYRD